LLFDATGELVQNLPRLIAFALLDLAVKQSRMHVAAPRCGVDLLFDFRIAVGIRTLKMLAGARE
jgi:hypothetical protein